MCAALATTAALLVTGWTGLCGHDAELGLVCCEELLPIIRNSLNSSIDH